MVLMRYLLFWAALLPAFDVGLSLFNLGRMVEPDCSFHSHLLARGAGLGPRGACALRNAGAIKCGGVGGVHIGDIVPVTDHEYEWLSTEAASGGKLWCKQGNVFELDWCVLDTGKCQNALFGSSTV